MRATILCVGQIHRLIAYNQICYCGQVSLLLILLLELSEYIMYIDWSSISKSDSCASSVSIMNVSYVCVCVCVYECVYECVYVCVYVYECIMYVCMNACVYVYMCMVVWMYR